MHGFRMIDGMIVLQTNTDTSLSIMVKINCVQFTFVSETALSIAKLMQNYHMR